VERKGEGGKQRSYGVKTKANEEKKLVRVGASWGAAVLRPYMKMVAGVIAGRGTLFGFDGGRDL
jgi:hypothetical protein